MNSQKGSTRPFFITATDTGAGKTHLAVRWLHWLRSTGNTGVVYKPLASGAEQQPDGTLANEDLLRLSAASGVAASELYHVLLEPVMAPQMAAEHQGLIISQQDLLDWCRSRLRPGVAFEGIGGLLVPICEGYRVADLIRDLSILPVLVTRTSLGTINATLLSVHAMRSAGITPVAVIASHTSNAPDGSWLRASGHIEDSIYPIPLIELPSVEWDAPPTQEEATALASLADVLKRGGR